MKTKLIENLKKQVLLVDGLPEDAKDITVCQTTYNGAILKYHIGKIFGSSKNEEIPNGNWKLLGKLKDVTESDCEGLVETDEIGDVEDSRYEVIYIDYQDEEHAFGTSKESFLSALEAKGLHLNGNPYEKPNLGKYMEIKENCVKDYQSDLKKWQEAEQNVFGENTLVFVEQ